jgi:hypothetical protein
MKCTIVLLMAVAAMSLIVSHRISCNPETIELTPDRPHPLRDNPYYTCHVEDLSITFEEDLTFVVTLTVPLDVEIIDIDMNLDSNEIATSVAIGSDGEPVSSSDWQEEERRKNLVDSMNTYLKAKQDRGEYTGYKISVPLVFTSEVEGTVEFRRFSIDFGIYAPEGLEAVIDCSTGISYFLWNSGTGSDPQYSLETNAEESFPESSRLLEPKCGIVGGFYKIEDLTKKLESGRKYFWRVRTEYKMSGKKVMSKWTSDEFVYESAVTSVTNLRCYEQKDKFEFWWENLGNTEHLIELNGHSLELEEPCKCSFTIEKTSKEHLQYLHVGYDNTLTIWAISNGRKSEPRSKSFRYCMPRNLYPNREAPVEKSEFDFKWQYEGEVEEYEIQLIGPQGNIQLPYMGDNDKVETSEIVVVPGTDNTYNPWGNDDTDLEILDLEIGKIYTWKIRAIPGEMEQDTKDEYIPWISEMFIYQPVNLVKLTLISAFGGLIGGFIRLTQEERTRITKRTKKFYLDHLVYMELFVGIIVGFIFYLMVNQTLSQQLNPLSIPPFNYAGSLIIGWIGGILSYDITRLRRVLPQ